MTLRGHTGPILSVAFSPGDGELASGSADASVRIWRVADAKQLATLPDIGATASLAFVTAGQIATGSTDGRMHLWDVTTRTDVVTGVSPLAFAQGPVHLAYAPSGVLYITADVDPREVRKLNVSTHEWTRLVANFESIRCLAVASDGPIVGVGCGTDGDQQVLIFDDARAVMKTAKIRGTLRSASFSSKGTTLATAAQVAQGVDEILIWNLNPLEHRRTIRPPHGALTAMDLSPDGTTVAVAVGAELQLWDLVDAAQHPSFRVPTSPIRCLAFASDGRTLVTGSADGTITLWHVGSRG